MKWKAGLTSYQKRMIKNDRLNNWHDYFAWFPVRITHLNNESFWYWLEKIQRKRYTFSGVGGIVYEYEYRKKP